MCKIPEAGAELIHCSAGGVSDCEHPGSLDTVGYDDAERRDDGRGGSELLVLCGGNGAAACGAGGYESVFGTEEGLACRERQQTQNNLI